MTVRIFLKSGVSLPRQEAGGKRFRHVKSSSQSWRHFESLVELRQSPHPSVMTGVLAAPVDTGMIKPFLSVARSSGGSLPAC